MGQTVKLQMDVAFDEEDYSIFANMLQEERVDVTVNNIRKAGGQWPEIIIVGEDHDIARFIKKYFDDEAEEIFDEFVEVID